MKYYPKDGRCNFSGLKDKAVVALIGFPHQQLGFPEYRVYDIEGLAKWLVGSNVRVILAD
jgi:hypothetical protein